MDVVKFPLESLVYSKLNPDWVGMVTGIMFRPNDIMYYVTWQDGVDRSHFPCELSSEKSFAVENKIISP